jgi:hypothetical protein
LLGDGAKLGDVGAGDAERHRHADHRSDLELPDVDADPGICDDSPCWSGSIMAEVSCLS